VGADAHAQRDLTEAQSRAEAGKKEALKTIKESTGAQQTWADTLVASANAVMGVASAINILSGMGETL
jgi:hypothetical protein